jgi:hypothetical protein
LRVYRVQFSLRRSEPGEQLAAAGFCFIAPLHWVRSIGFLEYLPVAQALLEFIF